MDANTKQVLDAYQWAVGRLAREYGMPYQQLPKWAKVDVQAGAKLYARQQMDKVFKEADHAGS